MLLKFLQSDLFKIFIDKVQEKWDGKVYDNFGLLNGFYKTQVLSSLVDLEKEVKTLKVFAIPRVIALYLKVWNSKSFKHYATSFVGVMIW